MVAVRQEGDELWLDLFIQPKASRDQIQGEHGDELKVAITAPPVDGQAIAISSNTWPNSSRLPRGKSR